MAANAAKSTSYIDADGGVRLSGGGDAVDGAEDAMDRDREDAAWFAVFAAAIAGTRLTGEFFEDDLVWGLRPGPPVHAVRRAEDDDRRRPDSGRDVRDPRIVADENVRTACEGGNLRQGEVIERLDHAVCRLLHLRERLGLVPCGDRRDTESERGEMFGDACEIRRRPLLRLIRRRRMQQCETLLRADTRGDGSFRFGIHGQRRRLGPIDLDAREADESKLLLDRMQFGGAPEIGGRTVKMRVCPRETIMREPEAIFGKRRGRQCRAGRAAVQVDDRVVTALFEPRGGPQTCSGVSSDALYADAFKAFEKRRDPFLERDVDLGLRQFPPQGRKHGRREHGVADRPQPNDENATDVVPWNDVWA